MKTVHTRLDHLWVQLQRRRAVGLSMVWQKGGGRVVEGWWKGGGRVVEGWPWPTARTLAPAAHSVGAAMAAAGDVKKWFKPDNPITSKNGGCWLQP